MKGLRRVLVLVTISTCVVTIALLAHGAGASTTYITGPWDITTDTTLSDGTWWVNGTVSVTGATLTLDRAELVICSTPGVIGLVLDSDSYLVATGSTLRGGMTPLVIDLGNGGSLRDCTLSKLGDPSLGAGIKCRDGRLSMIVCNITDGHSFIQGWSDLYMLRCRIEGYWGIGLEWTCGADDDVQIESSRFDGRSAYGTAIQVRGPGGENVNPGVSVSGCMFVNSTCPIVASDFTDYGRLAISQNIATDCIYGPRILGAGAALTLKGNIWDCGGKNTALSIGLGGEKAPLLTMETLYGTLRLFGDGQAVAVSSLTITTDHDGVVCDRVLLDISDSYVESKGRDFVLTGDGYIHIRRCSHSYTGSCDGADGAEIKELSKMGISNVTWQDGTPIVACPLWFVGGGETVVGCSAWGGPTTVELATWWVTAGGTVYSTTVRALTRQTNVTFYSGQLDPFASGPVSIALVDDFAPLVGVLYPRPGVLMGGSNVSVVGDYMEFGAGMGTIEVRFDSGPWALADVTTDDEWNLTVDELRDGQHTLDVRITDRVGNNRTLTLENVCTDTSSPVIQVMQPPPWVNYDRIRLVARTEVGARAYVAMEEVEVDQLGYFERSFQLEDGSNEFRLMAIDRAGNSFAMVYVVVYDVRPPTVVVDTPTDGSWLSTANVAVSGWAEETANVTVNGVRAVRTRTAFTVELPAKEGPLVVRVVAFDLALNSCTLNIRVNVDRTLPDLEVVAPSVDGRATETPILVSGLVLDAGPVTVRVMGARAALGGDYWSAWVDLDDGWNDIDVVATDAAGHQATAVRRVLLERSAPTVHATLVVGNSVVMDGTAEVVTGEPTANLTVMVDQTCLLRVTGMAQRRAGPGEVSVELDLLGGRNVIVVNVTDLEGRRGTVIRFVVERDVLPPAIAIKGPDRYSRTERAQVTVWGVTEPGAFVSINGTVLRAGPTGSFSIDVPLIEGVNEVVVVATDGFGNAANTTLTVFRVTSVPAPVDEEGPWKLATGAASGAAFLVMLVLLVRIIRDVRRAPRTGRAAGGVPRTQPLHPPADAYRVPRVRRRQGP